jgi:hypothetical protein
MLRAWIWLLFRDQNGPYGTLWVPSKVQSRVHPGLLGQFHKVKSGKLTEAIASR